MPGRTGILLVPERTVLHKHRCILTEDKNIEFYFTLDDRVTHEHCYLFCNTMIKLQFGTLDLAFGPSMFKCSFSL